MSEKRSDVFASFQIESAVVNGIADKVFDLFRNFSFDRLCPSQVSSVNFIQGQPGLVGSIVEIRRPNGQKVQWHIVEISDYNRSMMYELLEADPPFKSSNALNTIRVFKDTINNKCFLRWETNYSNDVEMDELARTKSLKLESVRNLNSIFGEESQRQGTDISSKQELPAHKVSKGLTEQTGQREHVEGV